MSRRTEKPIRNKKYLEYLRGFPCAVCGRGPCETAHQRLVGGGAGLKPGDDKALPCCFECHRIVEHGINGGVLTLWKTKRPELFGQYLLETKQDLRDYIRVRCESYYHTWRREND